jgi:hypothetical protein
LAANTAYGLYLARDDVTFAVRLPSALFWTGLFLVMTLAFALGAIMRPKEFHDVFKEEPVKRAAWLDELGAPRSRDHD